MAVSRLFKAPIASSKKKHTKFKEFYVFDFLFFEIRFFRYSIFQVLEAFFEVSHGLVKRFHDEWWRRRLSKLKFRPKCAKI